MRKSYRSLRLLLFAATIAILGSQAVPDAQGNFLCWREGDCWVCCDYCCSAACPWGDSQWC